MDYYLDTDLRSSTYFVVPWNQVDQKRYVIRFSKRYKAEEFLKGLSFRKYKDPIKSPNNFKLIEELELKGKTVKVFEVK